FAVPVEAGWGERLARIGLLGPGGNATLDPDTDRPVVILRDPRSGQVRGILRGTAARGLAGVGEPGGRFALQGLEVVSSRGIPGSGAWKR
ncbi:MAG: hypothetical protein OXQ93_06125, partial [Gemmatimonadota bacterium]|nr:hypothetical protein [bacterium]MDE2874999.1 hypothetical protein [Gemmatimonadota bacterium]